MRRRRKGALTAYRDATLFKVSTPMGFVPEAARLDVTDWYRNPEAPELGRYGNLEVRWGKASKGSPPRRRTVHTVMPWIVEGVQDYQRPHPPLLRLRRSPAMWLTERGGRVTPRHIEQRFADYRTALGSRADLGAALPSPLLMSLIRSKTEWIRSSYRNRSVTALPRLQRFIPESAAIS